MKITKSQFPQILHTLDFGHKISKFLKFTQTVMSYPYLFEFYGSKKFKNYHDLDNFGLNIKLFINIFKSGQLESF